MTARRTLGTLIALGAAALLVGSLMACNNAPQPAASANVAVVPTPSAGQVAAASASKVSFYAASRFAEQASFGPTPALVAELQAKGFERWIDDQYALSASRIDPAPVANPAPTNPLTSAYPWTSFGTLAIAIAPYDLHAEGRSGVGVPGI